MNWRRGVGASVLVVAASIPLIAAIQFPGEPDTDTPVQTSGLAQKPDHDPSPEAPVANQNLNFPAWAYTPRGTGNGVLIAETTASQPAMPVIVSQGNKSTGIPACIACHNADGSGRTETASLAGLPRGYMLQQLEDFKADERHNAVPGMTASQMVPIAAKISPEEADAAVEYFASLKPVKTIRVVETDVVPKTHAENWTLVPDADGATEPIGDRVIEMRDPKGGYVAYVPNGTLKKGEELVNAGRESCVGCHGPNLRGGGNMPPLAGRSPSAMARQLYDFQSGARKDSNPSLSHLTDTDIVALTGYIASFEP